MLVRKKKIEQEAEFRSWLVRVYMATSPDSQNVEEHSQRGKLAGIFTFKKNKQKLYLWGYFSVAALRWSTTAKIKSHESRRNNTRVRYSTHRVLINRVPLQFAAKVGKCPKKGLQVFIVSVRWRLITKKINNCCDCEWIVAAAFAKIVYFSGI